MKEKEFYRPWMREVAFRLVLKLWKRKGCPGRLTYKDRYGITWRYRKYPKFILKKIVTTIESLNRYGIKKTKQIEECGFVEVEK